MISQSDALRQADDENQMNYDLHHTTHLKTSQTTTKPTKQLSTIHHKSIRNQNVKLLSPTLHLNKKHKMLYVPPQFDKYEN